MNQADLKSEKFHFGKSIQDLFTIEELENLKLNLEVDEYIQEYIYNSFVIIALGSFGIAEAGKIFGKKDD